MIDLQAVRDSYRSQDISGVGWIRATNNYAEGMTRIGRFQALLHMLRSGKYDFQAEMGVAELRKLA